MVTKLKSTLFALSHMQGVYQDFEGSQVWLTVKTCFTILLYDVFDILT